MAGPGGRVAAGSANTPEWNLRQRDLGVRLRSLTRPNSPAQHTRHAVAGCFAERSSCGASVDMMGTMAPGSADFELTLDELRAVVRFAADSAQEALPFFEKAVPDDGRPRAAIKAAFLFADGASRTNLQRLAATDAHQAAAEATDEVSRLAAGSAGDAAAAAYLHPLAKATQVGHILRATARAAAAAELGAGDQPPAAAAVLQRAQLRATPVLLDVLHRYPPAMRGRSRTAHLMKALDTALRALTTSR